MIPESERCWLLALLLVFAASCLCWWPPLIDGRTAWLSCAVCAVSAGAATGLRKDRWVAITFAAAAGAAAGLISSYTLFPPSDPTSSGWISVGVLAGTLMTLAASFASAFAVQFAPDRWLQPRPLWTALGLCLLYSPVALSLTYVVLITPYHQRERLAEQRFFALKAALESSANESSRFSCDPASWRRFHRGAPLPESAWTALSQDAVVLDGYTFQFSCAADGSYTLQVSPVEFGRDGSLRFCTDNTRCVGSFAESKSHGSRCYPCEPSAPLPPPAPPPPL